MTLTTQYRDGKFKLNRLELSVPGGRLLGLTPYCARADIYESVLEPTVIVEFVITDKVGIFDHFNFLEEKIFIDFTTYEDNEDAAVKYELYPVIVDPAEALPDDKGIVYKITCVSREALKSTQIKNLSVTKQKIECETMIAFLLQSQEGLNSTKPLFLEKTQGLHAFNFTLVNPFVAIDEIRLKSMSSDYKGHCFVFYENSRGYHFKSFEGLIKDGLTKIGDKYYVQTAATDIAAGGAKWRNILAFKVIQTGNQNVTRALGAGKVTVKAVNINTQEITITELDPTEMDFVQLNQNSSSASIASQNELKSTEGRVELIQIDPTVETADIAMLAAVRPYYLTFLFNTIAHITVYGDSTVTVGDVITAKIPEMDGLTIGEQKPFVDTSSTSAGNYLVTKVRHTLTFSEGAEYVQAFEIVKDGFAGDAPKAS
jgi:hypothetical protein